MSWSSAPHVVMTTSNQLFLIMSLIIPRNPVETIAPINERNFKHFLLEIIVERMFKPSARFFDSNPPDCAISSKIFSIFVLDFITTSFTGLPGLIISEKL